MGRRDGKSEETGALVGTSFPSRSIAGAWLLVAASKIGTRLGASEMGAPEGVVVVSTTRDGTCDGRSVTGAAVSGIVGRGEGSLDGGAVGSAVDGPREGRYDGSAVDGSREGTCDGMAVTGSAVPTVGSAWVGTGDGRTTGGEADGVGVGGIVLTSGTTTTGKEEGASLGASVVATIMGLEEGRSVASTGATVGRDEGVAVDVPLPPKPAAPPPPVSSSSSPSGGCCPLGMRGLRFGLSFMVRRSVATVVWA